MTPVRAPVGCMVSIASTSGTRSSGCVVAPRCAAAASPRNAAKPRGHTRKAPVVMAAATAAASASSSKGRALEVMSTSSDVSADRYLLDKNSVVLVVGLSVHHTPVDLRERLAIPESEAPRVIQELCAYPHVLKASVLSTCNRMEVYVVARSFHPAVREVEAWMCGASGVSLGELRPSLFAFRDGEAAEHLMRVASGLDSLVVGEGQILAQVRQMYLQGQGLRGVGRVLNSMFKAAVTVGKRVRSETGISVGAVSVSGAAAELAALKLVQAGRHDLQQQSIVIIGAGKMGRLLIKHLASKGVTSLTVVNRSLPRAEALAEEFPGVRMRLEPLPALLDEVEGGDVVFCASGSGEVLLHEADLSRMETRHRLLVDISVPRNVHPNVGNVSGTELYNVDDLREVVASNMESRGVAVVAAEALIAREVEQFNRRKASLDAVPKIRSLRARASSIQEVQLSKYMGKLENKGVGLSEEQAAMVQQLVHSVVTQLLHEPTTALRDLSDSHSDATTTTIPTPPQTHWLSGQ